MPSTPRPALDPTTLTGLFARSVSRFPHLTAVTDDHASFTYAELDARSDDIASALRARGVRPEDRVGLHLDRGVEVFAAILGILKAGAAYVAVDTRYPDARRDLMLTHSGVRIVLTRPGPGAALGGLPLDTLELPVPPADGSGPGPGDLARPDGAASVLFTSGSSGTPKAVVLEHRNIVSFAVNPALPPLRPEDRTGQISSLSFDAFHFETWATLARGGQVVVLPPVPDLLAAGFRAALERRGITAMLVPTMVVNQVVREDRDAFAPLRLLHVGGDVLRPAACARLLSGAFRGELFNLYGPAETTTACTAHRVTLDDTRADSIPIGRPLDGVTVHLLGPDRRPVPPGAAGEIHIGGPGVGRGYLSVPGRPDRTDRAFVPSPLPDGPRRLYRTGDLARRRADGVLEFLGRADDQVKIRGYRVEPAEVARSLRHHPLVHDAVVLASGEGEDRHLVAFAVLDEPVPVSALLGFARERLPHYLVPSRIVVLPEIPATHHGKRDTAALRALLTREAGQQDAAPATDTERYLVGLWRSLLGVEEVGVRDDFFALGGHSLLAFRMQRRIERERGVTLEYRSLVRTSVLADLAALVDATATEGAAR
ncbi:non-ribosomal peptide synthetase [Streptomyces luomodiensis]|uniref:Non-ribosomal peptide synthetase n=1 Tax=Streptomyces luomodiensis TaxID=3026192 RepID=A0ABY9V809_9ACTN|nr:non-ribosomal peptide synthetase [Streptomyces sp. SCA4-21]WNF01046.1 non-ribosomal peptide synthetase [Streptomyces sp. SCA4-21]